MKKLKVGIVGARGLSTLPGFSQLADVEVTALCDLDADLLWAMAKKHGIPHTYRVYEDFLQADLDIVVVATPMPLHVSQSVAALEAGKHVLCEVTAATSMDELWWLLEAVEKSEKVYMLAENYCYMPQMQILNRMVDQGLFGNVYYAEGEYLHDIKSMRFDAAGKSTWRRHWQLGKRGNFYPTHSLGPIMQWFKEDRIRSLVCMGSGWNTEPTIRQEDTSVTLCQLESGSLIRLRTDCVSERPHNLAYYSLQGTRGVYEAPRGLGDTHKVWLKGMDESTDKATFRPLMELFEKELPERYRQADPKQRQAGHGGGDFFIVADFIKAIRSQSPPPIDVYDACEWTAVGLLSELSVMNGGRRMDLPDFRRADKMADRVTLI